MAENIFCILQGSEEIVRHLGALVDKVALLKTMRSKLLSKLVKKRSKRLNGLGGQSAMSLWTCAMLMLKL